LNRRFKNLKNAFSVPSIWEKIRREQKQVGFQWRCCVMGKTVESYRMALEDEIRRWKGFEKALRIEDKQAFEELMDACRSYASAGSNATQPILFEPMVISILLCQEKKIMRLEKKLNAADRTATS
jgi:hypothetical protein